ncbi:hypothetical protein GE21DRAFT_1212875 [Neurospora crassa]|nr:hypothetical protein B1D1.240 [imported] - Neurospora crassa [Neurospora crassa]KHE82683.1 hypothetical protein GE21DRAFT_1212875 [Neurospora crassa]
MRNNAMQANKGMKLITFLNLSKRKEKSENSTQGITLNFHRQAVVQLTARKADGGTACCSAIVFSVAPFRLVQAPQHLAISRASQCLYGRVALAPLPCHGSLSRVFERCRNRRVLNCKSDSNLPALSVEGPKRSTLLTRPGTAACAMGKIAASASWGDYSPFGSDRDRLHSSKNFCILTPRNNGFSPCSAQADLAPWSRLLAELTVLGPVGCFGFCAHFTCTILPPTRKRTQAWSVQAVHDGFVSYSTAIRK